MVVVGVDPISLGVLAPPADYGADFVVGDLQPLGIHMYAGGGCGGFVASRDEERFVREYPMIMLSSAPAQGDGGLGYGWSTMERTSYDKRHESTDYYGTTQWVWGIGAGVYLALMGPKGLKELGEGIMQRACYAAHRIAGIKGVTLPFMETPFFKEFVVSFDGTGKTVAEINASLRERDILGGVDLSREHPALGQSALYCVTEVHGKGDIDRLVSGLEEACQ
jgi:glycine dehydrogenase subunit 1